MILVDGRASAGIDARDRGLAYGDGVFRTLRLHDGRPLLWRRHYGKLAADAAALGIAAPAAVVFERDLATIATAHADGVVRITLTRGTGPRGYRPPAAATPVRVVAWSENPQTGDADTGLRVRWCRLRLAAQPALAGLKHLNRLENVLARAEWDDPQIGEGLLRDAADNVIGGTMSNLFLVRDGALLTPALDVCGVAGVVRALILECAARDGVATRVAAVSAADVLAAEAVLLVNSVIGVRSVEALEEHHWAGGQWQRRLRGWIDNAAREEA